MATPVAVQRNAFVPGLLGGLVLLVGAFVTDWPGYLVILYVVAILALICAWFAGQARQWWWIAPLLAIAVLWNPVFPFPFSGTYWMAAHILAGAVLIAAGMGIRQRRD